MWGSGHTLSEGYNLAVILAKKSYFAQWSYMAIWIGSNMPWRFLFYYFDTLDKKNLKRILTIYLILFLALRDNLFLTKFLANAETSPNSDLLCKTIRTWQSKKKLKPFDCKKSRPPKFLLLVPLHNHGDQPAYLIRCIFFNFGCWYKTLTNGHTLKWL